MSDNLSDAQVLYNQHLINEGKAKATVVAYTKDIEQLVEYVTKRGKTLASEITQDDIVSFKKLLKKQRYTSKSISRKINSIKSFFRFLISKEIVNGNPADSVSHPKVVNNPPNVLSKMEYRALRDVCKDDVRISAIIELLLQTGMRISELANLQIPDVDMERGVITIRARNSRDARRVPLNKAAKDALMNYLRIRPRAREKIIFLTKTCKPFLIRNIRSAIDRYFRLAGIEEAKVNDLRHTFIVQQLKAGTPLVYVSQLVGHKRITTTEKYLKLIEDEKKLDPQIKIEQL